MKKKPADKFTDWLIEQHMLERNGQVGRNYKTINPLTKLSKQEIELLNGLFQRPLSLSLSKRENECVIKNLQTFFNIAHRHFGGCLTDIQISGAPFLNTFSTEWYIDFFKSLNIYPLFQMMEDLTNELQKLPWTLKVIICLEKKNSNGKAIASFCQKIFKLSKEEVKELMAAPDKNRAFEGYLSDLNVKIAFVEGVEECRRATHPCSLYVKHGSNKVCSYNSHLQQVVSQLSLFLHPNEIVERYSGDTPQPHDWIKALDEYAGGRRSTRENFAFNLLYSVRKTPDSLSPTAITSCLTDFFSLKYKEQPHQALRLLAQACAMLSKSVGATDVVNGVWDGVVKKVIGNRPPSFGSSPEQLWIKRIFNMTHGGVIPFTVAYAMLEVAVLLQQKEGKALSSLIQNEQHTFAAIGLLSIPWSGATALKTLSAFLNKKDGAAIDEAAYEAIEDGMSTVACDNDNAEAFLSLLDKQRISGELIASCAMAASNHPSQAFMPLALALGTSLLPLESQSKNAYSIAKRAAALLPDSTNASFDAILKPIRAIFEAHHHDFTPIEETFENLEDDATTDAVAIALLDALLLKKDDASLSLAVDLWHRYSPASKDAAPLQAIDMANWRSEEKGGEGAASWSVPATESGAILLQEWQRIAFALARRQAERSANDAAIFLLLVSDKMELPPSPLLKATIALYEQVVSAATSAASTVARCNIRELCSNLLCCGPQPHFDLTAAELASLRHLVADLLSGDEAATIDNIAFTCVESAIEGKLLTTAFALWKELLNVDNADAIFDHIKKVSLNIFSLIETAAAKNKKEKNTLFEKAKTFIDNPVRCHLFENDVHSEITVLMAFLDRFFDCAIRDGSLDKYLVKLLQQIKGITPDDDFATKRQRLTHTLIRYLDSCEKKGCKPTAEVVDMLQQLYPQLFFLSVDNDTFDDTLSMVLSLRRRLPLATFDGESEAILRLCTNSIKNEEINITTKLLEWLSDSSIVDKGNVDSLWREVALLLAKKKQVKRCCRLLRKRNLSALFSSESKDAKEYRQLLAMLLHQLVERKNVDDALFLLENYHPGPQAPYDNIFALAADSNDPTIKNRAVRFHFEYLLPKDLLADFPQKRDVVWLRSFQCLGEEHTAIVKDLVFKPDLFITDLSENKQCRLQKDAVTQLLTLALTPTIIETIPTQERERYYQSLYKIRNSWTLPCNGNTFNKIDKRLLDHGFTSRSFLDLSHGLLLQYLKPNCPKEALKATAHYLSTLIRIDNSSGEEEKRAGIEHILDILNNVPLGKNGADAIVDIAGAVIKLGNDPRLTPFLIKVAALASSHKLPKAQKELSLTIAKQAVIRYFLNPCDSLVKEMTTILSGKVLSRALSIDDLISWRNKLITLQFKKCPAVTLKLSDATFQDLRTTPLLLQSHLYFLISMLDKDHQHLDINFFANVAKKIKMGFSYVYVKDQNNINDQLDPFALITTFVALWARFPKADQSNFYFAYDYFASTIKEWGKRYPKVLVHVIKNLSFSLYPSFNGYFKYHVKYCTELVKSLQDLLPADRQHELFIEPMIKLCFYFKLLSRQYEGEEGEKPCHLIHSSLVNLIENLVAHNNEASSQLVLELLNDYQEGYLYPENEKLIALYEKIIANFFDRSPNAFLEGKNYFAILPLLEVASTSFQEARHNPQVQKNVAAIASLIFEKLSNELLKLLEKGEKRELLYFMTLLLVKDMGIFVESGVFNNDPTTFIRIMEKALSLSTKTELATMLNPCKKLDAVYLPSKSLFQAIIIYNLTLTMNKQLPASTTEAASKQLYQLKTFWIKYYLDTLLPVYPQSSSLLIEFIGRDLTADAELKALYDKVHK